MGGQYFVSADERRGEVVHVRTRGAGDDEIAGAAQRVVGVVILEHVRHGLSCRGKALDRAAVREAARGVRRAVRAVRADREYNDVFCPRDLRGGGERELLVAPAQALAGQVHHGLAARDVSQLPASTRMGADHRTKEAVLDYKDIEGFPVSTVAGHKGRFVFGYVGDVKVVVMQGRVHYYEGYSMEDVVLPIRLMKLMGAKILFLTNAAGGVNYDYHAGDFMLISDQICMAPSPLIGENADELGPRFPDMSK